MYRRGGRVDARRTCGWAVFLGLGRCVWQCQMRLHAAYHTSVTYTHMRGPARARTLPLLAGFSDGCGVQAGVWAGGRHSAGHGEEWRCSSTRAAAASPAS